MKPQKTRRIASFLNIAALLALACHASAIRAEQADRHKPVHMEADQLVIDDARQTSTFEGNVQLSQGSMSIRGDRVIVKQGKDGFSHGTALGHPAVFRQKREGYDEYVEGRAERIEYDAKSETVEFIGQARMQRNHDEVRGEHISYNSRTEIFMAHGGKPGSSADASGKPAGAPARERVHAVIQPRDKGSADTSTARPLPLRPEESLAHPEAN